MGPSSNQANIKAVITAEDKASKTLRDFGEEGNKLGQKLKAGLLIAGTAAVGFAAASIKAFTESQNVMAQTEAVLKSTGGVAGVSAKQVQDLANSLQNVTKFSDETIQQGQNLLLTFTKISKDIFPEATEVMLDMSQALGQDVKASAIQLGKALQDPILGVTALRRVGVNFNDAQRDVIKNLVETGRSAEAQRLILNELKVEFGNSARAAGETFAGKLEILKNKFSDIQEGIGHFIVNALFGLVASFQRVWGSIQTVVNAIVGFLQPSLSALFNVFVTHLLPSLQRLHAALEPALSQVLRVVAGILGVTLIAAIHIIVNGLNVLIRVLSFGISVFANVASAAGSFGSRLISIGRSIADPFISSFNAIARAWNATVGRLNFTIPSWVPGLGGRTFGVPKIPTLAEGGVVTKPTLAMIGEKGPEAVVPLNRGGMQPVVHIHAQAFMGTQLEARKFAKMVMDAYADLAASKNMTVSQMIG
jgi:hypothetical protein